ncbi:MAG: phosphotransferase family protein [Parvibaculum sp.]|uniref:phosphotransferase family protein n=1 Tax=Parvibaculum sp. TaxID=2024848 RepID=UPI003C71BA4F
MPFAVVRYLAFHVFVKVGLREEGIVVDELNLRLLADYMQTNVDDFSPKLSGCGIEASRLSGGQSNPTFLIQSADRRYVLRKKPSGKLLPSAHQVEREYRVMKALEGTDVPVPHMYALCEDDSVIGTPFFIMEFLDGRIFSDPAVPGVSVDERGKLFDAMNAGLAALHQVDYEACRLGDYGPPSGFYERQIRRWTKQYRGSETDRIEAMENLIAWLPENIPQDGTVTIAHGDYRIQNIVFHKDKPELIGVLDWELSTLGHPMADLAHNCGMYRPAHPHDGSLFGMDIQALGIPSEQEYISAYCRRTGRDGIADWRFYIVYAMFKGACIMQGVYKRGLDGNAAAEVALTYGAMCRTRTEDAWRLIEGK